MRYCIKYHMIGVILVACTSSACDVFPPGGINTSSSEIEITPQSLVDTRWELVSFEVTEQGTHGLETGVYKVPDEEYYIIEFVGEDGFQGQMFCNSCAGGYEIIPPGSISISGLICTRAYCGTFFPQRLIPHSRTLELTQNSLTLFYESDMQGKGSLYFKKKDV